MSAVLAKQIFHLSGCAARHFFDIKSIRLLLDEIDNQAILAQLIEHSIRNRKVVGLNPMDGSIIFNNLARFLKAGFDNFPLVFPLAILFKLF